MVDIQTSLDNDAIFAHLNSDDGQLRNAVMELGLFQARQDLANLFQKTHFDQPEDWITHLIDCSYQIFLKYDVLNHHLHGPWIDDVLQRALDTEIFHHIKANLIIYLKRLFQATEDSQRLLSNSDQTTILQLRALQWDQLFIECLHDVLTSALQAKLQLWNDESFDLEIVPKLKAFLHETITSFIGLVSKEMNGNQLMSSLYDYAYQEFIRLRVSRVFEMVTEYPDSLPSILELRDVIVSTSQMESISREIQRIFQKRLLHLGASTSQILDVYVLMIRSLRHIDPSDMVLSFVAEPIRRYLMKRSDTLRCIVTAMTEEGSDSTLKGELNSRGTSLEYQPDEDDEEDGPGEVRYIDSKPLYFPEF